VQENEERENKKIQTLHRKGTLTTGINEKNFMHGRRLKQFRTEEITY
jgi:hypothetical protein